MANRQQELEALYEARKKQRLHMPQLSISDDTHHVTEAIGSYYGDATSPMSESRHHYHQHAPPAASKEPRPLSYMNSPSENESFKAQRARRHGTLLDSGSSSLRSSPASPTTRTPLGRAQSNERLASPTESNGSISSPKSQHRTGTLEAEPVNFLSSSPPPPPSPQSSTDTAITQFPLNDIDYESSPAAVQQELSNLNALRRMSMNIDNADPDLPSFSNIPTVAPKQSDDENDPSKLFWVPASLHPELAPKEFKTFIEDRVEKIRRRSGGEDSLSPDSLDRSDSNSSLRRKKSMLSHQIDTSKDVYEDGAERLERKRSKGMQIGAQTTVAMSDLEGLVNDPAQLMRRMSLDNSRRSLESGGEGGTDGDMPILPPVGTLKRSTRTTYRRGSLKEGKWVPISKRAQQRHTTESETEDSPLNSPITQPSSEEQPPILGLTRVQTEPVSSPNELREKPSRSGYDREDRKILSQSLEDLTMHQGQLHAKSPPPSTREQPDRGYYDDRPASQPPSQQPKQFQSRIASSGRTTAQLPGYNNTNPLPQIIETLSDGTKVPTPNLLQNLPERKSSHEIPRQFQRVGAHMRPVPGREKSSSLEDISSHPSPLPGSSDTRTDTLTLVPTFDERKAEKRDAPRKSSWKWILGNDSNEKKAKEDSAYESASLKSSNASKSAKASADKARLDVLQNSIDGTVPARGRESLVLNREEIKIDDDRKRDGKKLSDSKKDKEKDGLLSAIFGGKKKTSDGDLKEKRRKAERRLSPEPPPRILKPDIDYNWTRFSILEERAIYRMAHIKLANPRRALYSQVLLSNFMYSYLAKVQMMHPQIQIPAAQRAAQQRGRKEEQQQQQQQPPEYNQYQRWQEQQAREQAAQQAASSSSRTSFDVVHEGSQRASHDSGDHPSNDADRGYYDDYGRQTYSSRDEHAHAETNGVSGGSGYSVATTHDYLGYSNNQKGLWDDEERSEELW